MIIVLRQLHKAEVECASAIIKTVKTSLNDPDPTSLSHGEE
jgi:hypothetical protein